jgi:release factor glutamine methyltransferase
MTGSKNCKCRPQSARDAYQDAYRTLCQHGIDDAQATAIRILEHVLNERYVQLIAWDIPIEPPQQALIKDYISRCVNQEPVAYILGEAWFYGHRYHIAPGVLIPRPETELLVQHGMAVLDQLESLGHQPVVLECGVGSGVIGIELSRAYPHIPVYGWDISPQAIRVANRNIQAHGCVNMHITEGDFFEGVANHILPDTVTPVVIANPPYIDPNYPNLSPCVQKEPPEALFASNGGLSVIQALVALVRDREWVLLSEMGYNHRAPLGDMMAGLPVSFATDWAGHDRFVGYVGSPQLANIEIFGKKMNEPV